MTKLTKKVSQLVLSFILVLSLFLSPGTYAEVNTLYLDQDNQTAIVNTNCGGGNLKVTVSGGSEPTSQIVFDVRNENVHSDSLETGYYNSSTGVKYYDSTGVRTPDIYPVIQGSIYRLYDETLNDVTGNFRFFFWDSKRKYHSTVISSQLVVPEGAVFWRFMVIRAL